MNEELFRQEVKQAVLGFIRDEIKIYNSCHTFATKGKTTNVGYIKRMMQRFGINEEEVK